MRRALLAMTCLLTACESTSRAVAFGDTVTDSSGVQIVTNVMPAWTDTTRWRIDSIPITSIGGDDSDVQQQFKYLQGATRLSNGSVMIAVQDELRLFGQDGTFIRTVARPGDGPGEFRSIHNMWRLANDSVMASQATARGGMKTVVFSPDGSLAREERPDATRLRGLGRWTECQTMMLPDRSHLQCQSDPGIPASSSNRPSRMVGSGSSSPGPGHLRQLHRQYLIPAAMDTAYPLGIQAGIEQFGVEINGRDYGFHQHPFYAYSLVAAGGTPLRIAMMRNPEYRLELWTPTGTLERVILRAGGRRAPTAQERADAPVSMREEIASFEKDPTRIDAIINAIPTPDSLPAAIAMCVTSKGEIVVQREGVLPSQRASLFDVFSAQGRWLGEFRLPHRTFISEIGRDYLLTVRYDGDDVPHAEVFRLWRESTSTAATAATPSK